MNEFERFIFVEIATYAIAKRDHPAWLQKKITEERDDMRLALLILYEILSIDIVEMFFITKKKLETDVSLTELEKEVYRLIYRICKNELYIDLSS